MTMHDCYAHVVNDDHLTDKHTPTYIRCGNCLSFSVSVSKKKRKKKAKQKEAEAISLDADQTATQQDEILLTFCSVFGICA